MAKRLFCEINGFTYAISVSKERLKRYMKNLLSRRRFAKTKGEPLPVLIYSHKSLIRRRLGNVDMELQNNKAINLSIAAPQVDKVIIKPGEEFSFWRLVGKCTKAKGYLDGLTISVGKTGKGTGGGMCQFTNLLHWMTLHSPLTISEHHHHDNYDLFPDFGRQVPFGCGTSILYNYQDYRVRNDTDITFQFIVYTIETHLCGELRASEPLPYKYHIAEKESVFIKIGENMYRRNKIYKAVVDKTTGAEISQTLIKENNALVMYDETFIDPALIQAEKTSILI